jgi:pimeloyl-ACP methyl ester carboxylesterase
VGGRPTESPVGNCLLALARFILSVTHFGGSVAMKVAARLAGRVARLVLLETNPFYLLAQAGRMDAFAEAMELRNYIKKFGALGEWATAAEKFADYWNGAGTWREMSFDRRVAFSEALKPNFFEWDAVMNETTPVEQWATLLPGAALLVCAPLCSALRPSVSASMR